MKIVGFSGHRPQRLYRYARGERLNQVAKEVAQAVIKEKQPDAISSGMALCWDTVVAQIAMESQIPLHAYIPFSGQDMKWRDEDQVLYQQLLTYAQSNGKIVVCSEPPYEAWKMNKRNKDLVNGSTELVVLLNTEIGGGTQRCVQYATRMRKPVTNVWGLFLDRLSLRDPDPYIQRQIAVQLDIPVQGVLF